MSLVFVTRLICDRRAQLAATDLVADAIHANIAKSAAGEIAANLVEGLTLKFRLMAYSVDAANKNTRIYPCRW